jgi:TPR repeat protein
LSNAVIRHGWGCEPDTAKAVSYLSAAASNAADIEQLALQAGLKKGGAAKGELVLAIFELANCFRYGWGIPKDPIAAKQVGFPLPNVADSKQLALGHQEFAVVGFREVKLGTAMLTSSLQYYETAANLGDTGKPSVQHWRLTLEADHLQMP